MTAQARLLGGRYEVGELLGYGGMAEVHRGRDTRLGRDVAVKLLRSDLARDATFQARFRREAQNAAALNHPAIVAVYDTGEDTGPNGESLPYIVMEYVAGRTLKEVLTGEGPLQPRRALEVTADICAALDFSHRHGIIHRDIKPGNVMLTPSGQVKVMDFGIARALSQSQSTMTQTSAVIGTAQYLSPEQARGETVDARSDVYATGCVLYELMCGQPPFTGDNPVSVAYQHVREDPKPPSGSNPAVTPAVDSVVLKALAKNTVNRYQSAGEMRADLLRAAAGRPVQATPVMTESERTQVVSPTRRPGPATAQHARVPESGQRRVARWLLVALSLLGVFALVAVGTALYLSDPQVAVPDVRNRLLADATSTLKKQQLVAKPTMVTAANCKKDTVLTQSPASGTKVAQGSTVTLTVCGGPQLVSVPDIANYNKTAAEDTITAAKLTPKFVEEDSAVQEGNVTRTEPKAGSNVPAGTEITVYVSRGNLVNVPNVVGKTREEAEKRLRDAGFKVDVGTKVIEPDRGERANTVVAQDPRSGARKRNSTISIIIAIEPEPTESPTESPTPTPSDTLTP